MKYAVITTHDRPEQFLRCLEAVRPQVDYVIVVADVVHGTAQYAFDIPGVSTFAYSRDASQPRPNIYQMWNIGLTEASELASFVDDEDSFIAVLNDDAVVPPGWFDAVVSDMSLNNCLAGCSTGFPGNVRVSRHPGDNNLCLAGYAFITVPGRKASIGYHWWYGDNHFDWSARVDRGVSFTPGYAVDHPPMGGTAIHGPLAEIVQRDQALFQQTWGRLP